MTKDWDGHWTAELAEETSRDDGRNGIAGSLLLDYVEKLGNPRRWRSVLVVGCGISMEPAALAYAGYQVVAFDLSEVAVAHVRSEAATPEELARWLGLQPPILDRKAFQAYQRNGHDRRAVRRHLAARRRRGGSLVTLRSDFREFTPDRLFDVVFVPFVWSCLADDDRPEVARRAFAWLAPGGMCFVLTSGMRDPYTTALDRCFAAAGFFGQDECRAEDKPVRYLGPRFLRNWWLGRVFHQRWRAHGKRVGARLATGDKMYFLCNGSG